MLKKKEKKAEVNFAKAMDDVEALLRETHDIKETKGYADYKGEEITHSSILATSFNIKESVSKKGMKYNRDQNRSLLRVILTKVFQLGYCQAKIMDDNDEMKQFLLEIALDTSKKLASDLDKLKNKDK